jgi:hypothetical protein
MVYVEVAFKTTSTGQPEDGAPLAIMGSGLYIAPASMAAWFNNSTVPPGISDLPEAKRKMFGRRLKSLEILSRPETAPYDVAVRRWGNDFTGAPGAVQVEVLKAAQQMIDDALVDREQLISTGLDTNWGFEDRRLFGVMVADLSLSQVNEVVSPLLDETVHEYADELMLKQRRWRLQYEALLSQGSIDDIKNKDKRIVVVRNVTPFTASQLVRGAN